MTTASEFRLTGGCQCGAVRFALSAPPTRVGICHCRMCQKAVGGPFISLAVIRIGDFAWTRGTPSTFRSSSIAERDFCATCGTPLNYREIGGRWIEVTTGAFDRPDQVVATFQVGMESRLDWVTAIGDLPGKTTLENFGPEKFGKVASCQHTDHE